MHENKIYSRRKRKLKATTNSKHSLPIAPNLLNQKFGFSKPHQAWVADITYVPTDEGWLYLAAIEDLCHRKVIGWAMDRTMTKELVVQALNQAILNARPPQGVV